MPLKVISSREAQSNRRGSAVARWPIRGAEEDRFFETARPAFVPGFSFRPGATVFTIGSCFARHVEDVLVAHGFDVPTKRFVASAESGEDPDVWMLDNYSVPAIANELRWALGDLAYAPEDNLLEINPGQYFDLHLADRIPLCSLNDALARRNRIFETTRSIRDAEVLIMTLGLAEVWKDTATGVFLNTRPHGATLSKQPDRFQLWVLSYDEVRAELELAFETIRRHARPDLRTILTVSPVPMSATFTGDDVAVANTYSKSVLRTAAQAVATEHDSVDYYPSYESIMLSDRSLAWEDDQIHVRAELIEDNVRRMVGAYCGVEFEPAALALPSRSASAQAMNDQKRARDYFAAREDEKALACCALLTGTRVEAGGWRIRAEIHLRNQDPGAAELAARAGIELRHNVPALHSLLGRALSGQGLHAEATAAFEEALRYAPDNETVIKLLEREKMMLAGVKGRVAAPRSKAPRPGGSPAT